MEFRQKYAPTELEVAAAFELNKQIDLERKRKPGLSNTDLSEELFGRDMASPDFGDILDEENRRNNKRKYFEIEAWSKESSYATEDLVCIMKALKLRSLGFTGRSALIKANLGTNLGDRLERETIHDLPVIYLGSASDVEFPLSLRYRNIILVDPGLTSDGSALIEIRGLLQQLGQVEESEKDGKYCFKVDCDFGSGKETVRVECVPQEAQDYKYDRAEALGGILSFQGGNANAFQYPELMSHLSEGAIIFDNHKNFIDEEVMKELPDIMYDLHIIKFRNIYDRKLREIAARYGLEAMMTPGIGLPYYVFIEDKTEQIAEIVKPAEIDYDQPYLKRIPSASSFDYSDDDPQPGTFH